MSDCFDHEGDAWESLINGNSDAPDRRFDDSRLPANTAPKKTTCKNCGKKKLRWTNTENGWRLMTKKGKIHDCLKNFKCSMSKH